MPANTVVTRRPKRRRKTGVARRMVVVALLMVLLIIVGVYYGTQYLEDQQYARYPLQYEDEIRRFAAEFSLSPAHVAAVILCESSFRADAVSAVGALGLMQIMPDTGSWIAEKFENTGFDVNELLTPETNLRYGCWYLRWLLDRYGGDRELTTAAYHAGQGNVDKWLADEQYSPDGTTLVTIPFAETSKYTEKVLTAYEKYLELYDLGA